mmetsp:Transcript_55803/g.141927  ORF Transcript_55803/g.141927 Transcript_55803/m.141927 type:complete len:216 (+) Transcript_55803:635-1282(+)
MVGATIDTLPTTSSLEPKLKGDDPGRNPPTRRRCSIATGSYNPRLARRRSTSNGVKVLLPAKPPTSGHVIGISTTWVSLLTVRLTTGPRKASGAARSAAAGVAATLASPAPIAADTFGDMIGISTTGLSRLTPRLATWPRKATGAASGGVAATLASFAPFAAATRSSILVVSGTNAAATSSARKASRTSALLKRLPRRLQVCPRLLSWTSSLRSV